VHREADEGRAKDRKGFGKALAEFQAIQWKIADMATEINAARLLTQRAAWLKSRGEPFGNLEIARLEFPNVAGKLRMKKTVIPMRRGIVLLSNLACARWQCPQSAGCLQEPPHPEVLAPPHFPPNDAPTPIVHPEEVQKDLLQS